MADHGGSKNEPRQCIPGYDRALYGISVAAELTGVNPQITTLLAAGLNLAGVEHVLQLEAERRSTHDHAGGAHQQAR